MISRSRGGSSRVSSLREGLAGGCGATCASWAVASVDDLEGPVCQNQGIESTPYWLLLLTHRLSQSVDPDSKMNVNLGAVFH